MSKFKIGEAKTKGGHEAYIFEITEDRIFGKLKLNGRWMQHSWLKNGLTRTTRDTEFDLLPNAEPLRAEFEAVVREARVFSHLPHPSNVVIVPNEFADKRVKVTLEAMES